MVRSGPRPPCLRGCVAQAKWEYCESVEMPGWRRYELVMHEGAILMEGVRTENGGIEFFELGLRIVECQDLGGADKGEVPGEQ